jgi:hypothetical protein
MRAAQQVRAELADAEVSDLASRASSAIASMASLIGTFCGGR